MYASLHNLCHYESNPTRAIVSNRHFLQPSNSIYAESYIIPPPRTNFLPSFWGPDSWKFLETVAKGYSKNPTYSEKLAMRRFLESLRQCLPCQKCRGNFCKEVETLEDADLKSPEAVFSWLNALRTRISAKKRKNVGRENCCGK